MKPEAQSPQEVLLKQAIDLGTEGKLDEAIGLVGRVLDAADIHPWLRANALYFRGHAHRQNDQPELALADFQAVLGIPNLPREMRDDTEASVSDLERQRAFQRANEELNRRDYSAAARTLRTVVEGAETGDVTKYIAAHRLLLVPELSPEMKQCARDALNPCGAAGRDGAEALFSIAVGQIRQDRITEAIELLGAVITFMDAEPALVAHALEYRSVSFFKLGLLEASRKDAEALLALTNAPEEYRKAGRMMLRRVEDNTLIGRAKEEVEKGALDEAQDHLRVVLDMEGAHDMDRLIAACALLELPDLPADLRERAEKASKLDLPGRFSQPARGPQASRPSSRIKRFVLGFILGGICANAALNVVCAMAVDRPMDTVQWEGPILIASVVAAFIGGILGGATTRRPAA